MLINLDQCCLSVNRIGVTAIFTRGGKRIATGFEDIVDGYVKIPASMIDMAVILSLRNASLERDGKIRIVSKDRCLKRAYMSLTGDDCGYVYVRVKDVFKMIM